MGNGGSRGRAGGTGTGSGTVAHTDALTATEAWKLPTTYALPSGVTVHYERLSLGYDRAGRAITGARDPRPTIHAVFGRDVPPAQLAALMGAGRGDTVRVKSDLPGRAFVVELTGKGRDGEIAIGRYRGLVDARVFEVHNAVNQRSAASGRDIVRAIGAMRAAGIDRIRASAARADSADPTRRMNGYYTWARIGFTGPIPASVLAAAQARFGARVSRVEQLMPKPGGAAWWKQHGTTYDATFDLRPGSKSMRVFSRFAAARGPAATGNTGGEAA